jgi:hypothetical protein
MAQPPPLYNYSFMRIEYGPSFSVGGTGMGDPNNASDIRWINSNDPALPAVFKRELGPDTGPGGGLLASNGVKDISNYLAQLQHPYEVFGANKVELTAPDRMTAMNQAAAIPVNPAIITQTYPHKQ